MLIYRVPGEHIGQSRRNAANHLNYLARPERFELPTPWFVVILVTPLLQYAGLRWSMQFQRVNSRVFLCCSIHVGEVRSRVVTSW